MLPYSLYLNIINIDELYHYTLFNIYFQIVLFGEMGCRHETNHVLFTSPSPFPGPPHTAKKGDAEDISIQN